MKTKPELLIKTQKQWTAVSSPTRAAILESITALGQCSVKEIAHSIGKSAELVHHHLPILLETEFVLETDPRKSGRHVERMFIAGADRWVFDPSLGSEEFVEGFLKMARAWGRANERMLADRLGQLTADERLNLPEALTIRSETARLSPDAKDQVRQHLQAIKRIFATQRTSDDGRLYTIFWSAFDVVPGNS